MAAPDDAPAARPDPLTVLVVDDNLINAKLLRLTLEARGHRVHVAADGRAALDCLAAVRPDVALVDVQMPNMDGLELARILRADPDTARLPIAAVTACATPDDEAGAYAAGVDAFVTKPVDTRLLVRLVESLAAGARGEAP